MAADKVEIEVRHDQAVNNGVRLGLDDLVGKLVDIAQVTMSEKNYCNKRCDSKKCDEKKCDEKKCDEKKCDEKKCDEKKCDEKKCDEKKCDEKKCDEKKCDEKKCDESKCNEKKCDEKDSNNQYDDSTFLMKELAKLIIPFVISQVKDTFTEQNQLNCPCSMSSIQGMSQTCSMPSIQGMSQTCPMPSIQGMSQTSDLSGKYLRAHQRMNQIPKYFGQNAEMLSDILDFIEEFCEIDKSIRDNKLKAVCFMERISCMFRVLCTLLKGSLNNKLLQLRIKNVEKQIGEGYANVLRQLQK